MPAWDTIEGDSLACIFQHVAGAQDLCRCSQVCRHWREVLARNDGPWRAALHREYWPMVPFEEARAAPGPPPTARALLAQARTARLWASGSVRGLTSRHGGINSVGIGGINGFGVGGGVGGGSNALLPPPERLTTFVQLDVVAAAAGTGAGAGAGQDAVGIATAAVAGAAAVAAAHADGHAGVHCVVGGSAAVPRQPEIGGVLLLRVPIRAVAAAEDFFVLHTMHGTVLDSRAWMPGLRNSVALPGAALSQHAADAGAFRNPMPGWAPSEDERVHSVAAGGSCQGNGAGGGHAVAVTSAGRAFVWGCNSFGQLGLGGASAHQRWVALPTAVALGSGVGDGGRGCVGGEGAGGGGDGDVSTAAASGGGDDAGLSPEEAGGGGAATAAVGPSCSAVNSCIAADCGPRHTVLLGSGGAVFAAGSNRAGACGQPLEMEQVPDFQRISLPPGMRAASVSAGAANTAVVTECGTLLVCGDNSCKQLGQHAASSPSSCAMDVGGSSSLDEEGERNPCCPPPAASLYGSSPPPSLASMPGSSGGGGGGGSFSGGSGYSGRGTPAQRCSGALVVVGPSAAWHGMQRAGQRAQGGGGVAAERVARVACGAGTFYALTRGGDVFAWGAGGQGELGTGGNAKMQQVPSKLAWARGIAEVAASGGRYGAAFDAQGRLFTWGSGKAGQLGHGDVAKKAVGRRVKGLAGVRVVGAAACADTLLALATPAAAAGGCRSPPSSPAATAAGASHHHHHQQQQGNQNQHHHNNNNNQNQQQQQQRQRQWRHSHARDASGPGSPHDATDANDDDDDADNVADMLARWQAEGDGCLQGVLQLGWDGGGSRSGQHGRISNAARGGGGSSRSRGSGSTHGRSRDTYEDHPVHAGGRRAQRRARRRGDWHGDGGGNGSGGRGPWIDPDLERSVVRQLRALCSDGDAAGSRRCIEFPPELTPAERYRVHVLAQRHGLAHESYGWGPARQLVVRKMQ